MEQGWISKTFFVIGARGPQFDFNKVTKLWYDPSQPSISRSNKCISLLCFWTMFDNFVAVNCYNCGHYLWILVDIKFFIDFLWWIWHLLTLMVELCLFFKTCSEKTLMTMCLMLYFRCPKQGWIILRPSTLPLDAAASFQVPFYVSPHWMSGFTSECRRSPEDWLMNSW